MQNTSLSLSLPVPPDRSVVFNALEVTYQVLQCAESQGISPLASCAVQKFSQFGSPGPSQHRRRRNPKANHIDVDAMT